MTFGRIPVWTTTALGVALAMTFILACMMRPAVAPDDVEAIRMVAVPVSIPDRLPLEFRLENTGRRPVLVTRNRHDPGVTFDLAVFGPDGASVPLPRWNTADYHSGSPIFTTLEPGQRSEPLEGDRPLSGWQAPGPGRYRFVATYRYIPLDVRWQGLPILGRWCEVDSEKHAAQIRRTRAFTRTMDFEIDLP